ncbi:MAG: DUF1844 domain-containing protein [Candidatus Marinimicrobia bacterium]|nr:DUF1844 domain-containing protein [Candidatus Neomarinimicrobiota bacterium]
MSEKTLTKDEQLFLYLVSTFQSSALIAMGRIKNPMSDTIEKNLDQATFYISLLDTIQKRTMGNLSQEEEQFLISAVSDLNMNMIEEKQKKQLDKKAKA